MKNGLKKRAGSKTTNRVSPVPEKISVFSAYSPVEKDEIVGKKVGLQSTTKSLLRRSRYSFVSILLHLIASAIFATGFLLRTKFHNGDECDMTYSMRQFLELKTDFVHSSYVTQKYKLWKFVDRRDPRYQHLLKSPQPLTSNYCGNANQIVLFVPGHWGSYGQSRSLGAHGIQLTGGGSSTTQTTKVRRALANNLWSGDAAKENEFIYDVYSVDFAEQGAALHGEFLNLQSDFVAFAAQQLVDTCQVQSITIVGHSMGGYVARLTPIRHPQTRSFLKNIITLATPHKNPIYGFEKSVKKVHQLIEEKHTNDVVVVSISGGLKDELIAPSTATCHHQYSLSVLSPKLLPRGSFGMDHRAIVWCHGVLNQVRKTIWALVHSENASARERIRSVQSILSVDTYERDLQSMIEKFHVTYGYFIALTFESAMLYNLPILAGLYAVVGGLRCAFPDIQHPFAIPLSTALYGWLCCDVSKGCVLVLSLVADTLNSLLIWLAVPGFLGSKRTSKSLITLYFGLFILFGVLTLVCTRLVLGAWWVEHSDAPLYLCNVLVIYLSLFLLLGLDKHHSKTKIAFASLISVITPLVTAGPIMLMAWEQQTRPSSWFTLYSLLVPVCVFCWLQVGFPGGDVPKFWKMARFAISVASVLILCPSALARGNGFRVAESVAEFTWVQIALHILSIMLY